MHRVLLCLTTVVALLCVAALRAQTPTNPAQPVTHHAKGTFEVKTAPVPLAEAEAGDKLARLTLDKQFSGDLAGTGRGEMLAASTEVKGSAGYVAIERVSGTLAGHRGSFVFQHSGTMNHGVLQLSITVVPDSGTGELAGLAGTFKIDIVEGKHLYDFEYTLP